MCESRKNKPEEANDANVLSVSLCGVNIALIVFDTCKNRWMYRQTDRLIDFLVVINGLINCWILPRPKSAEKCESDLTKIRTDRPSKEMRGQIQKRKYKE